MKLRVEISVLLKTIDNTLKIIAVAAFNFLFLFSCFFNSDIQTAFKEATTRYCIYV